MNTPGKPEVEAQLDRVVSSAEFRKSARMCRFLTLVTREALNGNAGSLKEYLIGTEVFDKDESFDPRVDAIVRNEARRLRRKLEMYYLVEGKSDLVVIELPKGGYAPVFAFRTVPAEAPSAAGFRKWRLVAGAAAVIVLMLAGWWVLGANRPLPVPRSPAAAEAYALGRHLLFNLKPDDITASRSELQKAIRLNPADAGAFAALALNYQASVVFGLMPRATGAAKSRELAVKAAAVSPEGAEGEAALAGHLATIEEDYAEAARHFAQALARDPNDAALHAQYAVTCLLQLGKLDEARREARKASELDPRSGLPAYALVVTDYCARDYRSAAAHAQEALVRQPDSVVIPPLLVDSYLAMGSFDEAWFFVEKGGVDGDAYRALIRAAKGHGEDALRAAQERTRQDTDPVLVARLFAAGGDAAPALDWLKEADRRHAFNARISARYAPDWDALRPSAEFAGLLAAMIKPRRP